MLTKREIAIACEAARNATIQTPLDDLVRLETTLLTANSDEADLVLDWVESLIEMKLGF